MAKNKTQTTNGMPTYVSSNSALLDLFSKMGSMRDSQERDLTVLIEAAYKEDPSLLHKMLFHLRDLTEGMGERKNARIFMKWYATHHPKELSVEFIPVYGRWDDLLELLDTPVKDFVLQLIKQGLEDSKTNSLCAKWMPRQGPVAGVIRSYLKMSPKAYRKMLVSLTNVVETKMCTKDWGSIEYSKLPSKASLLYRKAFFKRDCERYQEYLAGLIKGETKVNAKTLHPHELVMKQMKAYTTRDLLIEAQWKALPNWLEGSKEILLPVCDVSDSMSGLPLYVSIAMGLYVAERNLGPLHNQFITFHENPTFHTIKGETFAEKINNIGNAQWGGSTDIELTFNILLKRAKSFGIPKEEMPTTIIIFSDMQFNKATRWDNNTIMGTIKREYSLAGYELPKVVFWNLNATGGQSPVTKDENGVAMISGFSPSGMKHFLTGKAEEKITPLQVMMDTLMSERYEKV